MEMASFCLVFWDETKDRMDSRKWLQKLLSCFAAKRQ
jgi:hypothetical protein